MFLKMGGIAMNINLQEIVKSIQKRIDFSGAVFVKSKEELLLKQNFGYANRSEQIENSSSTRFGIASGCKLFTAIAICQLVERGEISFDSKLSDCIKHNFKHFDDKVTIHHLLTHTAGIPDYFDEEFMDDFEELWIQTPMYRMRTLKDFLPLFQDLPMKLKVGERFHYNNAGYILLGLVVEQASQCNFDEYIQKNIFDKAGMTNAGFFELDALPANTAQGYIDFDDGTWKTNIYSLPAKGGSDGGAFVTVHDLEKLWDALMSYSLLSEKSTKLLLTPHAQENQEDYYGYGVWIKKRNDAVLKYHIMGYDPGVSFHAAYYPDVSINVVVCSNKSNGAFDIVKGIEEQLIKTKTLE